jgi:hypothetical protein
MNNLHVPSYQIVSKIPLQHSVSIGYLMNNKKVNFLGEHITRTRTQQPLLFLNTKY